MSYKLEWSKYKLDIKTDEDDVEEPILVSAAMEDDEVLHGNQRPFTMVQHLCSYTMDIDPK